MTLDSLRDLCLSFPDATENVQWGADLVFKVGGKMFAVACLEPADTRVSFKCTPEAFADLVEMEAIRPATYVGRYGWVALERWDALSDREIRQLVRTSYDLVRAKLPKPAASRSAAKVRARKRPSVLPPRGK